MFLPVIILVMFCIYLSVCVSECLFIHTQPCFAYWVYLFLGFIINYMSVLVLFVLTLLALFCLVWQ